MKYLLLISVLVNLLCANEFYAKLEPIDSFKVKSSVSGKILFTNNKLESKKANNSVIVKIDSSVNQIELEQMKNKLKAINEMIKIEQNNYNRMLKVSSKSGFEKDSQKLKVINLKVNKADLLVRIASLKDIIKNKRLIEKSNYIYNITVKKGDYVNPGTLLYESKDLSKGKLEIFIPISDVKTIKNKKIYLDGKLTNLKIRKLFQVADSNHISSYKAVIVVPKPQEFSKLVKIEFK